MPSRRAVGFSLAIGVTHAAGLLLVALGLGYSIGPSRYSIGGLLWRYGGLLVVAAIPVWLAVRFHLITPVIVLVVTAAYVLGIEFTPPGPTFRGVAELEDLAEPTGITVVENGLVKSRISFMDARQRSILLKRIPIELLTSVFILFQPRRLPDGSPPR